MGSPSLRNPIRAATRDRPSILSAAEDGFTLIELVVSALIIVLIGAGVAQGLIAGAHMSAYQRERSQADALAQQDQERLRGLSAKQLDGLSQTVPLSLDGTNYTITSTAAFVSSTGGAPCSSTGSGAAAYYSTASTVSWRGANGTSSVKEESLITPPAGGTLLVKAVDQTGAALSGVGVTASGTDIESGTTDSGGCVIMSDLTEGSYNLTFTRTGYVDPNSNPSPLTATASLTSSGTATPSIGTVVMGQAATVNVNGFTTNFANNTPLSLQNPEKADSVSWYGAGGTYSMQNSAFTPSSLAASTATTAQLSSFTASNLFPFAFAGPTYANDYQVWAGPCRQMQPPVGYDEVAAGVTPGSSQNFTVQEPAINLTDTYNGSSVQPTDIKVSFQSTSGSPSCTHEWSVAPATAAQAASTGWLSTPGQPFASTATSAGGAMPMSNSGLTGTLSICADYLKSGTYHSGSSGSFTNTNFASATTVPVTLNQTGKCP
jgi:type II secretory pathway pseudopilin PulG